MKLKKLFVSISLAIIAIALISCSDKSGDPSLSDVAVTDISVTLPSGEYSVQKQGEEYLLILPSANKNAKWSFKGKIKFGGKTVSGGDTAELSNGEITVETAKGSKNVRVSLCDNLPALHISLKNGEFDKINASPDHSYKASGLATLSDAKGDILYSGELSSVRGRGNSTWRSAAKRPYQIEFPEKLSLLGLAEAKKYVLLANYYDRSLLRNTLAFDIADKIFDGYSPAAEFVDLFVDGAYQGCYLLCEKIDISSSKIDITDMEKHTESAFGGKIAGVVTAGDTDSAENGSYKYFNIPEKYLPDDISGGYLLQFDFAERYIEEDCGFVTKRGVPIVIKAPEHASKRQVEYIREYVCDFEDALYSEDGINEKGKHYSEYAELDALAMRYLFEEYTLNIDGGLSSFYIYKDKGNDKMQFSCVWDYDCALGNYNLHADLTKPDILFISELETRNAGQAANWFYALMRKDDFAALVKEKYPEFKSAVQSEIDALQDIADIIRRSADCDELLYGKVEGRDYYKADSGSNFDEAVQYLSDFMNRRLEYFNGIFGG